MSKTYALGTTRRAVNVIVTSKLKAGLGAKSTYLLTTRGHHFRATPEITLRRGHTSQTLQARELSAEAAGPVLQSYLRHSRVTAPFFDAKADDPTRAFVAEAGRHPVFELTAATGPSSHPAPATR